MCITPIQAQLDFEWDTYGVGFTVARDFGVTKNNFQVFEATSSDQLVSINIQPWSDSNITMDNLYDAVISVAYDLRYYEGGDVAGDYIKVDDFNGYFIVSAPASYDTYDYVIVALLLDSLSETNLQVIIGYQEGNFEEAKKMLYSFYAYDE
jgi:hypothetical protein